MKKDWIKNLEIIVGYICHFWISQIQLYERLKSLNQHIKVDEIMKEIENKNKII